MKKIILAAMCFTLTTTNAFANGFSFSDLTFKGSKKINSGSFELQAFEEKVNGERFFKIEFSGEKVKYRLAGGLPQYTEAAGVLMLTEQEAKALVQIHDEVNELREKAKQIENGLFYRIFKLSEKTSVIYRFNKDTFNKESGSYKLEFAESAYLHGLFKQYDDPTVEPDNSILKVYFFVINDIGKLLKEIV